MAETTNLHGKFKNSKNFWMFLILLLAILNILQMSLIHVHGEEIQYILSNKQYEPVYSYGDEIEQVTKYIFIICIISIIFFISHSKKYQRKIVLSTSAVASGILALNSGIAHKLNIFILLRLSNAIFFGAMITLSFSLISSIIPKINKKSLLGYYLCSFALGLTLTFLNFIRNSYKIPYLTIGLLTMIVGVLIYFVIDEPERSYENEEFN